MNKLPLNLGFATLYTALDAAGFVHALHGLNITPWNPAPALGLLFGVQDHRVGGMMDKLGVANVADLVRLNLQRGNP